VPPDVSTIGLDVEGDRAVTVPVGEQWLHTVKRLTDSQERVTEALIASQDQLAALRALIGVPIDSLDDNTALESMLLEALELTSSDCVVLVRDDVTIVVGPERQAAELQDWMSRPSSVHRSEPLPIELPSGAGVAAWLGDRGRRGCLGLARRSDTRYSTGDLQLMDAVVAAVNKLMSLTDLHRRGVQQAAIDREHQLASSLVQAILQTAPPSLKGVDVFATSIPASLAGGDFFVFEVLDGVLWFAVGDVAGKGLPAAIVMTRAVSAARVAFHTHPEADPAAALGAVGDELFDYLSGIGLFVTMALGSFRPGSGVVHLANAGHSPLLSSADGATRVVPPSMPPIGVVRAIRGRTQRIRLGPNDLLVLGSDGLAEQEDAHGVLYGYDRLLRRVEQWAQLTVNQLGDGLMKDVHDHAGDAPASDDRTLVVLGESRVAP
jgi:serine phosphatase RsbU (regulator of sigma subunit)